MAEVRKLGRFALLETEVGVPQGTLNALATSTDHWAMVLKLHALIEAALARVIVSELDRPELSSIVYRMQTGNPGGTGRLAIAVELGLLDGDACQRIEGLTMLRNRYAHDPANASLSIPALLQALPEGRRAAVSAKLPSIPTTSPMDPDVEWRHRVWIAAMDVLSAVLIARERQIEAAAEPLFEDAMAEAIRREWDKAMANENSHQAVGRMVDLFDYKTGTWSSPVPPAGKDEPPAR